MKAVIFIILKVLEVAAIVFVPWLIGWTGWRFIPRIMWEMEYPTNYFGAGWCVLFTLLMITILFTGIIFIVIELIKINKEWSTKINEKIKARLTR